MSRLSFLPLCKTYNEMKNMPKPSVISIATLVIVAVFQLQPATAQHWHGHGYGAYHHSDHEHFHGHYHDSHYSVQDNFHYYHDSYDGHEPIALGYVDMPLNQYHGNSSSVYCPDDVGCPLQYNQPALGGLSQPNPPYQDAPYLGAPRQYQIPSGAAGSVGSYNDHGHHDNDGHDHGDHSHDGHSHGPMNPSLQNRGNTFASPDRQPMTVPTLPNRNLVPQPPRFNPPSNRHTPPSDAPTNHDPIRMDGPPPSLTSIVSSSVDVG